MSKQNDYGIKAFQAIALTTAVFKYPDYPLASLAEEVGEVTGKIGKHARKNKMPIWQVIESICEGELPELKNEVSKELGDIIWQWSVLCACLGIDPADVMEQNNLKLASRSDRGVLNGEGDNR